LEGEEGLGGASGAEATDDIPLDEMIDIQLLGLFARCVNDQARNLHLSTLDEGIPILHEPGACATQLEIGSQRGPCLREGAWGRRLAQVLAPGLFGGGLAGALEQGNQELEQGSLEVRPGGCKTHHRIGIQVHGELRRCDLTRRAVPAEYRDPWILEEIEHQTHLPFRTLSCRKMSWNAVFPDDPGMKEQSGAFHEFQPDFRVVLDLVNLSFTIDHFPEPWPIVIHLLEG
jgi:hypothetical protein